MTCLSVSRGSQAPPFSFAVHVGIYCWYHSSEVERKNCYAPWSVSGILRETMKRTPHKCENFMEEVILPVLGPSPAKGISRILTKERWLTNTVMLRMMMEFLGMLLSICPSIVEDVQAAESLLMALATVTQGYLCQYHEMEEYGPHSQIGLARMRTQTSLAVFHTIW